jgi:hypothetical protein
MRRLCLAMFFFKRNCGCWACWARPLTLKYLVRVPSPLDCDRLGAVDRIADYPGRFWIDSEWAGQANQSLPSHCPVIREFDLPAHRGGVCVFLDATLNKGLFSGAINDITFTHLLPGIIGLHVVRAVSVANTVVGSGLVLVDIPYVELPPTCRLVSNCAILRSSLVPYLTTPCRRVCRRPKAYDLLCVCSAAFVWFRSFSKISTGIKLQNLFTPRVVPHPVDYFRIGFPL